jgi:hypothetical protein
MTDPASAQQIVQQVHPSWFDWITVAALLLGPFLALLSQRVLDWLRENKQRRVNLYMTVMGLRGTWVHPDSLRALNSIDTVFDKGSDSHVREAWVKVIRHVETRRPDWDTDQDQARAWDNKLLDLRVDLYQVMGAAVGINHSVDYIKSQFYYPELHMNAELDWLHIRQQLVKVITENGIKVLLPNG